MAIHQTSKAARGEHAIMKAFSRRSTTTSMIHKSGLALLVGIALSSSVQAQQPSVEVKYAIPSGELVQVVNEISRKSGLQIVYDVDALRGIKVNEIKGSLTVKQALNRALKGTNLTWKLVNPTTVSIMKKASSRPTSTGGVAASLPTPSKTDVAGRDVHEMDTMVVVGSRLATSPIESAMPIKLITREDIERSGATSIAQALSYLSEVSINNDGNRNIGGVGDLFGGTTNTTTVQLRGLPLGSTLVLINGRRPAGSAGLLGSVVDLSVIPVNLVERIEVLPAGASAIYGGDGLAGVVNIVLRQDASGTEVSVNAHSASNYWENSANVVYGKNWSRGNATLMANWRKKSGLNASDRAITADQDYRRFGGDDFRRTWSNPANIYSTVGCPDAPEPCDWVPLDERGNLPGLTSPVAVVPSGQNGQNLTPSDFSATAGQINFGQDDGHLFSPEEVIGLGFNGTFKITEKIDAFSELSYSRRNVPAQELLLYFRDRVPASNPFNPFGVEVEAEYQFANTGIFREYHEDNVHAVLGFRGQWDQLKWEISGWNSRDSSTINGPGYFDFSAITNALASTDPNTALNPFVGDGSAPASADVLRTLLQEADPDFGMTITGVNGFVSGPVFKTWAGSATGLIGAEFKKESLDWEPADGNASRIGDQETNAVFAEARVPLMSPRAPGGKDRLTISGAFRRESSVHQSERSSTEAIGLEWRPIDTLLVRGSYSSAFKPAPLNLTLTTPFYYYYPARDPVFDNQLVWFNALLSGGLPNDVNPETSKTRTVGVMYTPDPSWKISATYWETDFDDRFSFVNPGTLLTMESAFPERIVRDPITNRITFVDSRLINISKTSMSGLDFEASASFVTRVGNFYPALAATYTKKYEDQIRPSLPVRDNLSILRTTGWAPKWKIVPRLTWSYNEEIVLTALGRYVSSYQDPLRLSSGENAGQINYLGDFWQVDVSLEASLGFLAGDSSGPLSKYRLQLGARNVGNQLPEFCNSCGQRGYDASQYDIMGRLVYLSLKANF